MNYVSVYVSVNIFIHLGSVIIQMYIQEAISPTIIITNTNIHSAVLAAISKYPAFTNSLTSNTDTLQNNKLRDVRDSHIIFFYFIKLSLTIIIQLHLSEHLGNQFKH